MSQRDAQMSAREAILSNIAQKLDSGRRGLATVEMRIREHQSGIVPQVDADPERLKTRFVEKARLAAASAEVVARPQVGEAISRWLREHNLPQQLRHGMDERLAAIRWPEHGGPQIAIGRSDGSDLTGLSHAFAGVAETGTLMLVSGQDNPTTLNFLPENHIVLVEAKDIAANYETVWSRLREKYGEGRLPRTVNMVTGPSRSADIEQTLILGAHGPVRLHILVVEDQEAAG